MPIDVTALVEQARAGQPLAVARLISLVEEASPHLRSIVTALAPLTGRARVLGLTGPPGVGKSTATSALITALRARGQRIGVLAIDPSSPFSGGALLGDRIRMHDHATDPDVFIRSMATRGQLGGLALATPQAVRVLDAAGYDVILIETVGVGQSEVDIVSLADTTLVLLAPGLGDGIQAAKAGILEIADIFVVNKSDRPGADQTARDLTHMISLGRKEITGPRWRPPVISTIAATHTGIDDLVSAIDTHHAWLTTHAELDARRTHRAAAEIEALALATLRSRLTETNTLPNLAEQVAAGDLDPYTAADHLINP
ncbi:MAG TPA: methylmalonyl Co-A mutase-associated GTPase MeaB [Actinophytocola sp.]|uniref:methylmalonyl Co-A mutase-associated GTPase MeaB n=1 Tax=Actinophytocola sp. TaxID=1872138 RepID=UPI002DB909E8|nr:methylmalonyl Co-A mutase-associated GTPase MeaB [Actinophytocola sp.]HEU5470064.1 methylmalonyl Co-A mutase-associated GTPase MeaB [Actinophytocola sp.]